jgi:ankyrin repeat protein
MTPLHLAIRCDKIDVVETLLRFNADVNIKEVNGWTPASLAQRDQKDAILRLLQRAGELPKRTAEKAGLKKEKEPLLGEGQ